MARTRSTSTTGTSGTAALSLVQTLALAQRADEARDGGLAALGRAQDLTTRAAILAISAAIDGGRTADSIRAEAKAYVWPVGEDGSRRPAGIKGYANGEAISACKFVAEVMIGTDRATEEHAHAFVELKSRAIGGGLKAMRQQWNGQGTRKSVGPVLEAGKGAVKAKAEALAARKAAGADAVTAAATADAAPTTESVAKQVKREAARYAKSLSFAVSNYAGLSDEDRVMLAEAAETVETVHAALGAAVRRARGAAAPKPGPAKRAAAPAAA